MNDFPLVSVIIPCYNSSAFLEAALNSVCGQSYANIEIIIVNDGSTDNTEEIIKSISDNRIKYFFQQNKGQCAASNLGIQKSTGDYIKFFDADDLMNPDHLEEQLKRLEGSTKSIASCAWGRFYDGNPASTKFIPETVWKDLPPLNWIKAALTQKHDMMGAWLWLIPRELLEKAGGWDERLSLNNDFEFSIRLLLQADKILFTPNAKVFYRSGLTGALSQVTFGKNFEKAFLSTQLGCTYLLAAENSKEMKLICANRYQEWIFRMYPKYPELIKKMEEQIVAWGGSTRKMEGGKFFKFLDNMFGWRKAKKIKSFFYSWGYSKLVRSKY